MDRIPEEFIEAHVAVCHREGKKYLIPEGKPHRGTGKYKRVSARQRKRQCAKRLYKRCLEIGIEPTPITEVYRKAYEAKHAR